MSEKVLEKKRAKNGRCVDVVEFVKPDGKTEKRTKFVAEDGRPGERAPKKEAKAETKTVETKGVETTKKTEEKKTEKKPSVDLPAWVGVAAGLGSLAVGGVIALLIFKPKKPAQVLSIVREAR